MLPGPDEAKPDHSDWRVDGKFHDFERERERERRKQRAERHATLLATIDETPASDEAAGSVIDVDGT